MVSSAEDARFGGRSAVVVGGSMAGLMAARVLADHFDDVTLLERDESSTEVSSAEVGSTGVGARKGVPQGQHVHILLMRGKQILSRLFPDLIPSLLEGGASELDFAYDFRWFHQNAWRAVYRCGLTSLSQSRPFVEEHVRRRVAAIPNVRLLDRCKWKSLVMSADGKRVAGVEFERLDGDAVETLSADLVVDATGRGSVMPRWLESLGYPKVEETVVKVKLGYSTRIYERPEPGSHEWKMLVIYGMAPNDKRMGLIWPIEGDRWIVTLCGIAGDYPPDDEEGFLAYAKSLARPDIHDAIKDVKPLTDVATIRFPTSQRRHYEKMSRIPEGLIVVGDAACSFNPLFGQGMTVATAAADVLERCLQEQRRRRGPGEIAGLAKRFFKQLKPVIDAPWMITTIEDFRYPDIEGKRPPEHAALAWYIKRVIRAGSTNPEVLGAFLRVMHLLEPPTSLLHPAMLWRVLNTPDKQAA